MKKNIRIIFENEEKATVEFEECRASDLLIGTFVMIEALSKHTGMSKEETALRIAAYFKCEQNEQE